MRTRAFLGGSGGALVAVVALAACSGRVGAPAERTEPARLVTDGYADPALCARCHATIAESYRSVAMARSLGRPGGGEAIEDYERGNRLEHRPSGFTYEMRREGGRFFQRRFEQDASGGPARIFDREITYVIGSGRHARSYLHVSPAGEITELPVTWYSLAKSWGMSPGYDNKDQPDFFRSVTYRCLFCHDGYPAVRAGADSEIRPAIFPQDLPLGIDCQRCHGPGARHADLASRKQSAFAEVRASIVNPRRLPPERQMEICMQCHLETTSDATVSALVLFGRGIFSYHPDGDLASYRIHFDTASGRGFDDKFEIAHQVYRLRQSRCFRESGGRLTCITCHDPHRRPDHPDELYSGKCLGCHAREECGPTRRAQARGEASGAGPCAACHMPKRRTDDVVHVVMTDHRIGIHPPAGALLADRAERKEPYRGPVLYYRPEEIPAGSSKDLYLAVANVQDEADKAKGVALLEAAIAAARPRAPEPYLQLGISQMEAGRLREAIGSLSRAAELDPGNPRVSMALGNALGAAGQVDAALRRYDGAVALWPAYSEAETNAGNLLFQSGKATEALLRYDRAIALRADNAEAHSNRGAALVRLGRLDEAVAALTEALRIDPRRSEAYNNLGIALQRQGENGKAVTVLREGHARNPSHTGMTTRLAFLLATAPDGHLRDGRRALDLAEEAVRATSRRDAAALDALAAALAETGDTAQAARVAGEAERVAAASGQPDLAAAIRARREGYDRGRPYREGTVSGAVR